MGELAFVIGEIEGLSVSRCVVVYLAKTQSRKGKLPNNNLKLPNLCDSAPLRDLTISLQEIQRLKIK